MLAYKEEKEFYQEKSALKNALRVTKTVEIDGKKYMLDDVAYVLQNAEKIFGALDAEILRNEKRERMLKNTFMQLFCVEMFTMMLIILSLAS